MLRFAVLALAFLITPSFAIGACDGKDHRDTLPPESMMDIRAGIADVPFREGIAFEAVRGDKRLTLFGTIHTSDPAVFIPDEIASRTRTADLVLVEVTEEAETEMQRHLVENPSMMLYLDGPGLRTRLTEEEWETLSGSLSELGISPESADRMRAGFVAMMLEIPPCEMIARASGGMSLDMRVEMLARDVGVPVEALDESFETTLAFFLEPPEEKQLDLLRMSLAVGAADNDVVATAIGTWRDEEPLVLWEIARQHAATMIEDEEAVAALFREAHDSLIVRRNRGWLARILNRLHGAQNIVIAVGGMHLPGDQGLVRMLEAEGFVIRRLIVF